MRFHRVEVDNWRPFKGQSSMDFAASDDQPITLVFGKNGGGKTALLTALYWCMYGAMDLEEGKGTQNLVNDHAVREANATKDSPAYAVVTIYASRSQDDIEYMYRISRRQRAYESRSGRTEAKAELVVERIQLHAQYRAGDDVALTFDQHSASCERFERGAAQDCINSLLPHKLAKYFFYPGETLSFPFRNDDTSIGLLDGFLREISGGNKFEPFRKRVKETRRKLDARSKRHAEATQNTKSLQQTIDELNAKLAESEAKLPEIEAERKAAAANRVQVINQINELDALRDVLEAAERARTNEKQADDRVTSAEQALSHALGEAYLVAASPVFDAVMATFESRQYPSDVSSSLVKQLRDSMECICGRELTPEMLERLEPLSPTDDSVSTRMLTLNSHATSLRTSVEDRVAVDRASVALRDALSAKDTATEERAAAEARLKEAGGNQFEQVDKGNLLNERSQLDDQIREFDQQIGGLQQLIRNEKDEIDRKETEKHNVAPRDHRDVHEAASIARRMGELLEAIAAKQAEVAREELQDLINENYVIYKDNIEAVVDPELRVSVLDHAGGEKIAKPVGDLSGAETALLTYAFAAAAAKLLPQYQTLDKLLTTRPAFTEVERIPLVVDAPFSNLGTEYKRKVMALLSTGFSQVIMFTESTDTDILQEWAEIIGAEYLVHHEGEFEDDIEGTFVWKGETLTYASPGKDGVRSSLERIGA